MLSLSSAGSPPFHIWCHTWRQKRSGDNKWRLTSWNGKRSIQSYACFFKMLLLIEQTRSTNNATEGGGGGGCCVNLCDALDGSFHKGCVIFDRIKTDFLRQLRLPAAYTLLQRQKKKGSNYAEMKAWQNERCFQLEPWLFHYFNIYKDEPPTVVWAMQYAILCVCVCVGEREREKKGRRRQKERQTNSLRVREWHSLTNWIRWMSRAVRND